MSRAPPVKAGKLSFCLHCKKDTETIIVFTTGILWPLKSKRRICKDCAEAKPETVLEMEHYGKGHY